MFETLHRDLVARVDGEVPALSVPGPQPRLSYAAAATGAVAACALIP